MPLTCSVVIMLVLVTGAGIRIRGIAPDLDPPPPLTLHAPIDLLRELFNLVEVVLAPIGEGTLTVIQIPIEARDPPLQLELRPPPLLPPLLGTRLLTAKETARVSLPLKEGNITRGTER